MDNCNHQRLDLQAVIKKKKKVTKPEWKLKGRLTGQSLLLVPSGDNSNPQRLEVTRERKLKQHQREESGERELKGCLAAVAAAFVVGNQLMRHRPPLPLPPPPPLDGNCVYVYVFIAIFSHYLPFLWISLLQI